MGTILISYFKRTGLLGDIARLAAWAVAALLLGVAINALNPAGLPLWPAPGQRVAVPGAVWQKIKFADVEAAPPAGKTLLLDVREPHDYAEGHPPQAKNLPYREFSSRFPDFRKATAPDTPLYLYCYGTECGTSLRVASRLVQSGFSDVTIIRGGFEAWQERGLPTVKGGEPHG